MYQPRDRLIEEAVSRIEHRFTDARLKQHVVAAELGVSASSLSVRFKRASGVTFSEYLRTTRLARAASLLAETALSVKEVWASVGYNDFSNFDHDFKRCFSVTPREYRTLGRRAMSGVSVAAHLRPRKSD